MANIASAKKRILVTAKKQLRNKMHISKFKTLLKKYNQALSAQDVELSKTLMAEVIGYVDNLKHKGILHPNNADRKKSAIAKKLNKLTESLNKKEEAKAQ